MAAPVPMATSTYRPMAMLPKVKMGPDGMVPGAALSLVSESEPVPLVLAVAVAASATAVLALASDASHLH